MSRSSHNSRPDAARRDPVALVRLAAVVAALAVVAGALPARAEEAAMPAAATSTAAPRLGKPPFEAWLDRGAYWPRRSVEKNALAAGVWRRGDRVRVIGCTPRCDLPRALGIVEGGAIVPLRYLEPLPLPPDVARTVDFEHLLRGRVIAWRAPVYAAPRTGSKVLRKDRLGYLVAFVADPEAPKGWLRRWQGGWMRESQVKLLEATAFHGVDAPKLPMAFTIRSVRAREVKGGPDAEARAAALAALGKTRKNTPEREAALAAAEAFAIPKYAHFAGAALVRGRVEVPDGRVLPRWKTRIAWPRTRPARVGAGELWAHVDLAEQTMVIYRGDQPLRATLVSTGKPGTSTRPGFYRMLSKVRMSTMAGSVPEPYVAEAVPFVQHFYQGQALHGAWWHDGFGGVRSHGCINLPPADARWLFEQSPPPLPEGWRGVLLSHGDPRLALLVEKETPKSRRKLREPEETDDRRCVERRTGSRSRDCPFDAFEGNEADD
ncbi:MAG: L,D-transpeptidase [Deltaproteobacteria bacterium]|nr:L,D-transpeptidase [Deltaproteobacteria bacterium]